MKLKGKITSIRESGDDLLVEANLEARQDGRYALYRSATIALPPTEKTKRSLWVGREISVTVEVK